MGRTLPSGEISTVKSRDSQVANALPNNDNSPEQSFAMLATKVLNKMNNTAVDYERVESVGVVVEDNSNHDDTTEIYAGADDGDGVDDDGVDDQHRLLESAGTKVSVEVSGSEHSVDSKQTKDGVSYQPGIRCNT